MKRKENEDFGHYQARRRQENFRLNYYLKHGGAQIWDSEHRGQYIKARDGKIGHLRDNLSR